MATRIALEEIYDAVFDDAAFDHLLGRIADAVGARSFVAGWHSADQTATLFADSGYWSAAQMAEYVNDYALIDPWNVAQIRNWQPNRAIDLQDLVSSGDLERSTLHNDFFRRIGDDTFRVLSLPTDNASGKGAIAFHRGKSQQGFDRKAVRLLDGYATHLTRLLALRGRFAALERRLAVFGSALDHVAQAVMVVRGDGKMLDANAAAETLLRSSAAGTTKSGRFDLKGIDCRELRTAIAAACDPAGPRSASMLLARAHGSPLVATVAPMRVPSGARLALLVIQEIMPADESLAPRLQSLFGLTPAEAAIAGQIADGHSPAEIAGRRGVATETVRAQIKSLMQKLGCRRQTEAAAIIRSIVPVVGYNGGVAKR